MSETINLSFPLRGNDYVWALRAHYSSRLRVRFDIIAASWLRCLELILGVHRIPLA